MSILPSRTLIKVKYEGVNVTTEINEDMLEFSYKDNINSADEVSITLKDDKNLWIGDWFPLKGDKIEAEIHSFENSEWKILDCGEFFLDDKSFSGSPQKVTLKAISIDITTQLKNENKTKIWQKTSVKKIGEGIAKAHKLAVTFTGKDFNIQKAEQKEQSDGGFLQGLCVSHGYGLKLIKSKLQIIELKEIDSLESIMTFQKPFMVPYSIQDTDNDTYDHCIIEYHDAKLGKKIKGEASVKRAGYKTNTGKTYKPKEKFGVSGTESEKRAQLNRIAASKLREKNQEELTISFPVMGNTSIFAGRTFKIEGFGVYDKVKWMMTSVEHTYSGNGYRCNIEGRQCLDI